ncbi:hypothetical protein FB451DRAFT_1413425 [Mycena latifolia]|nr:hypothetical protein FB451DRAFT_1413425 [Mycena latifolia]
MLYCANPPSQLKTSTPRCVVEDLDFTKYASLYSPEEHWLGWTPTASPPDSALSEANAAEDPVEFLFRGEEVKLDRQYTDIYGADSDDGSTPQSTFAGVFINKAWVDLAIETGRRLHSICMCLAVSNDAYCRKAWLGQTGDVPGQVDETDLRLVQTSESTAREVADRARRAILSMLGFIAWFQSLIAIGSSTLSKEDQKFVKTLCLEERPKAGVLYKLSRDYHEASFSHLIHHSVPVHYAWTEDEKGQARFRRLSPEYWNEYSVLRGGASDDEVDITQLPSYEIWCPELERYDWFFQDLKAGKMGVIIREFKPHWIYRIVDFRLYGARLLTHWHVIRAYSERFKATVAEAPEGVVCTFFRQNPLRVDEPPHARSWPAEHEHALTDFADEASGQELLEGDVFYEPTAIIRDFVGEYEGNQDNELEPGEYPEDELSSVAVGEERIETLDQFNTSGDAPFPAPPSPSHSDYERRFRDEAEAIEALHAWAPSVVEMEPRMPALNPEDWDIAWLSDALFMCEDPRSVIRLKTLTACNGNIRVMEDVLELAVRFGIPFQLYIRSSQVCSFGPSRVSPLAANTLGSVYEPGFNDLPLFHGVGGGAATYGWYRSQLYHLLDRPHAVAFIGMGGVLSYVASLYNPELVKRFMQGPSLQLTHQNKGASIRMERSGYSEFYVTDEVSNSEIQLLLGHIPNERPGVDATLWPPPEVMENESPHMTGYLSSSAYNILENLKEDFLRKRKFKWRTSADWKGYFRIGGKGKYALRVVPKDRDFEQGKRLLARSYPLEWSGRSLAEIQIPEKFESPPSRQD